MSDNLKNKEVSAEMVAYLNEKGLTPKEGTKQPQPPKNLINSEDIQQFINSKNK